jgi:hypothetical protein
MEVVAEVPVALVLLVIYLRIEAEVERLLKLQDILVLT